MVENKRLPRKIKKKFKLYLDHAKAIKKFQSPLFFEASRVVQRSNNFIKGGIYTKW